MLQNRIDMAKKSHLGNKMKIFLKGQKKEIEKNQDIKG